MITYKITNKNTREIREYIRENNLKIVDEETDLDGNTTYYVQKRDDLEGVSDNGFKVEKKNGLYYLIGANSREAREYARNNNLEVLEEIEDNVYILKKRLDVEGADHNSKGETHDYLKNNLKPNTTNNIKKTNKKDNKYLKSIVLGEVIGKPKFKK